MLFPVASAVAARLPLLLAPILSLLLWPGLATAVPVLFDVGDGPVQEGWTGIDPVGLTATSEGIQVTLSAIASAGLDDRERGAGGNGGGAESDMWRDFVFAVPDPAGHGIRVDVSGLVPGASYDVTIWSFDSAGAQVDTRVSLWNDVPYTFQPRGAAPETLDDRSVTVRVEADASGIAEVLGESFESTDPGVFINGLRIDVPEPSLALLLGLALASLAAARSGHRP